MPLPTDAQLELALQADRHRLRRLLRQVREAQQKNQPHDKLLARLEHDLQQSQATREARRRNLPKLEFDEQLPISARRDEIARAIAEHPVVVVCGETGSGKSTQLPKICLSIGRGIDGLIGHTQPRRIAARTVAARLAEELHTPLGQQVGFKIRFTDSTGPQTLVKLMTDGILLAESQSDRFLDQYDTIIIDEAHERSLNIDFLLGYLQRLLTRRRNLKVIITSATIDAQRFAAHFGDTRGPAPIIEVSGRTYPVEVRYQPIELEPGEMLPDIHRAVANTVDEICRQAPGDVLIFMPTERDIHESAKTLRSRRLQSGTVEILPLYARLSTAEQQRIFKPHNGRRVVIATNVAESSLTVPGIRYVIDPGTARISRYSGRTKMQRLPIEAISQASANQRMGRCGRVGPGICIRLYSQEDFQSREPYTAPEIQRTNLASVVLQAETLGLGAIDEFPFLDPPRPEAVRDGYRTLFELGAIDEEQRLTQLGQRLGRLPVDPRVGRMVLAAYHENALPEVLIIAAALEVQDPRERPHDQQQAADSAHAQFQHAESDFLFYLNLWDWYHQLKEDLSRSKLDKACRQNFLNQLRMREWLDVHRQLVEMVEQGVSVRGGGSERIKVGPRRNDYAAIHRALATGLLANIAQRGDGFEYTVAGGGKSVIWPGSGVFENKPKWIIAAEQIETTKRYLRCVAKIDPGWLESLAPHLIKRSHFDPHWDSRAGQVMGYEKLSLYGLVIHPKRRLRFAPIDAALSRRLFIQHGLVEGDVVTRGAFLEHNQQLLERVQGWEAKSRCELLRSEDARFEFYDKRIPPEVNDTQSFEKWRRDAERSNKQLLLMTPADLLADPKDEVSEGEFPDAFDYGSMKLPLKYRHEPGAEDDGVTVVVPQEGLNHLDRQRLGWLVPGLLEEKITALIKSLPKTIRTRFVPIPDTAKKVLEQVHFGQGSIQAVVAEALAKIGGVSVRIDDFQESKLPDYLRMNVRVVDPAGTVQGHSRDIGELQRQLGAKNVARQGTIDHTQWRRDGITSWDFGALPAYVELSRGNVAIKGFPAIIDRGENVSLRLLDLEARALRESRLGVRRLFYLASHRELENQITWLPNLNQLLLFGSGIGDAKTIRQQLAELIADRAFLPNDDLPSDDVLFKLQLKQGRARIGAAVQDVMKLVTPLLKGYHDARLALDRLKLPQFHYVLHDVHTQLEHLTVSGFLTHTPWPWLQHYPRYLRGIVARIDKLFGGRRAQDQQAHQELEPRWREYLVRYEQHREHDLYDPALIQYRWMLEEWRVSLFAQELGTSLSVSAKRLDKQWSEVRL